MLVLSRKIEESIVIGEEDGTNQFLKITVLDVGNGKVKLGFEADDDVSVFRQEVWNRIRAGRGADVSAAGS
jgi:carbon storage regulator